MAGLGAWRRHAFALCRVALQIPSREMYLSSRLSRTALAKSSIDVVGAESLHQKGGGLARTANM